LAESKSRNAAVSCDAEVCYAFGWEAREALAVKRRAFITLLGGAAVAWPLKARAQQADRGRRIGVLIGFAEDDHETKPRLARFRHELERLGWSEGRNLRVDYRFAHVSSDRFPPIAKELVALKPDVILAHSTPVAAALFRETGTIPIVFLMVADPIGSGFVQSLPRPGGNMTGFTPFEPALGGKWLQLLKEVAPPVIRAALLFNSRTAPYAEHYWQTFQAAASSFSVEAITTPVDSAAAIEGVLDALGRERGSGLLVMPDGFNSDHRELIVGLTARYRIPAIYPLRQFTAGGGLISYGVDAIDEFRRATSYVDRILKGEKPADMPVQAPTKYEMVINLKTAKALGLAVPASLLAIADEVIE
jgi:putative ABC transport system substrate-binding protein